MIHVNQGDGVPILVIIENDTYFFEEQMYIKLWGVLVHFVVDNNL